MSELVARTGRQQQRYEDGYRLIAGCIPFRHRTMKDDDGGTNENIIEVLMINSTGGPGLLFPKVGSLNHVTGCTLHKALLSKTRPESARSAGRSGRGRLRPDMGESSEIHGAPLGRRGGGAATGAEVGGWENDETAEEAAEREAMEEAGVRGDLVHFLGCYSFKSKTLQDEYSPEGLCRAAMYALHVKEELDSWPEKSHRQRSWLTVGEAIGCCRHAWMREALEKGFSKWCEDGMIHTLPRKGSS
ncbi:hypothetical protein SASPL_126404 [Salvia splendens]|uniref:Nudix hydrolase domain-containing protein n=1 Tax=Salvia splendens TaxID=180675 RepID=A0A8X8XKF1_SALSN|nr:hypothetical protein SASPL_126404 [Salvia splendens]